MPFYGEVEAEGVYFLRHNSSMRIPTPPTMKNHGNHVASLSQLSAGSRSRQRRRARRSFRRRSRRSCSSRTDASSESEPATRAAAASASGCPNFEPGSDIVARVTILCEGTQGHLTGVAIDTLRARGREPAGLGARREGGLEGCQAAAPGRAHARLAAAPAGEVPRVRRLVHLPDGRRHAHDRDGRRARLPRRRSVRPRPAPAAEDEPVRAQDARGRRAHRLGCEDDPGGWLRRAAEAAARAWAPHVRRRGGDGQRARAEGDPLRRRVGPPGGRGGGRRAAAGADAVDARSARRLRRGGPRELHLERPQGSPQHAPGVRPRLLHGRRARRRDDRQQGQGSLRETVRPSRMPSLRPSARTAAGATRPRTASSRSTSSRASISRATARETTRRTISACGPRVPRRDRGHVGADVPGTGVRGTATGTSRSRRRTASSAGRSPRRAAA